jgi:hypothetical protein
MTTFYAMANMTDLPAELLEQIFQELYSIEDVHHLGRVCKVTCHLIRKPPVYTGIMRTIISKSPQHRFGE